MENRRRSSILKSKSPARCALAIIESNDGEKAPNSRMRRVSFAEKNEIKEFESANENIVRMFTSDLGEVPRDCLLDVPELMKSPPKVAASKQEQGFHEGAMLSSPPDGKLCVEENEPEGILQLDDATVLNTSMNKYAGRQTMRDQRQRWFNDDAAMPIASSNNQPVDSRQSVDMLDTTMFDEFFDMGDTSEIKDDVIDSAGKPDILLAPTAKPASLLLSNDHAPMNGRPLVHEAIARQVSANVLNKTQILSCSMEETSVLEVDVEKPVALLLPTGLDVLNKTQILSSSMEETSVLETDSNKPVDEKRISDKTNLCMMSMDMGDVSLAANNDLQAVAIINTNQLKIVDSIKGEAKLSEKVNDSAMEITLLNDTNVATSPYVDIRKTTFEPVFAASNEPPTTVSAVIREAKVSASSILQQLNGGSTVSGIVTSTTAVSNKESEEEKVSAKSFLQKLQNNSSNSSSQQILQENEVLVKAQTTHVANVQETRQPMAKLPLRKSRRSSVMDICNSDSEEEDSCAADSATVLSENFSQGINVIKPEKKADSVGEAMSDGVSIGVTAPCVSKANSIAPLTAISVPSSRLTVSSNHTSSIESNSRDSEQHNEAQASSTGTFQSRLWQRDVLPSVVPTLVAPPSLASSAKAAIKNETSSETLSLPMPANTVINASTVQQYVIKPPPAAVSRVVQPQITNVAYPRLPMLPMAFQMSTLATAGGQKVTSEQTRRPEAVKTCAAPIDSLEDGLSPRKKGRLALEGGDGDGKTTASDQLAGGTIFATKTIQFQDRNKPISDLTCVEEEGMEDVLENFSLPAGVEDDSVSMSVHMSLVTTERVSAPIEQDNQPTLEANVNNQTMDMSVADCSLLSPEIAVNMVEPPKSVGELMERFALEEQHNSNEEVKATLNDAIARCLVERAEAPVYQWAVAQMRSLIEKCEAELRDLEAEMVDRTTKGSLPRLFYSLDQMSQEQVEKLWKNCCQKVDNDFLDWKAKLSASCLTALNTERAPLEKLTTSVQRETHLINTKCCLLKHEVAKATLSKEQAELQVVEAQLRESEVTLRASEERLRLLHQHEQQCVDFDLKMKRLLQLCPCSIKVFNTSEAIFAFMDDQINMKLLFTADHKIARITFSSEESRNRLVSSFTKRLIELLQKKFTETTYTRTSHVAKLVQAVTLMTRSSQRLLDELSLISEHHLLAVGENLTVTVTFSNMRAIIKFFVTFSCSLEPSSTLVMLSDVRHIFGDISEADIRQAAGGVSLGADFLQRCVAGIDHLINRFPTPALPSLNI